MVGGIYTTAGTCSHGKEVSLGIYTCTVQEKKRRAAPDVVSTLT